MKEEEVIEYCKNHLASLCRELTPFKVPRYLEYWTDLPKNTMGRVMKEVLKQERSDLTEGCYDREKEG